MSIAEKIAVAPNATRLNALLPSTHCINGSRGTFFWLIRGQIVAEDSFRGLRSRIAAHYEGNEDCA